MASSSSRRARDEGTACFNSFAILTLPRLLEQRWAICRCALLLGLSDLALLLVVKPLADLLFVPLVVELEEAGEHLAPGGLAEREPNALLRLMEAVSKIEVG